MTLPTDEEVKEYLNNFITIFWTEHSKNLVTRAITGYTEWLREREGNTMKDTDFIKEMKHSIEGKIYKTPEEDKVLGGGHRICSNCGETVFGSALHHCKQKIKICDTCVIAVCSDRGIDKIFCDKKKPMKGFTSEEIINSSTKKTMKDISSPEGIKKSEEFVEMIKNGTIKNRHTTIYVHRIACDRCKHKPYSYKGCNYMDSVECAYFEGMDCSNCKHGKPFSEHNTECLIKAGNKCMDKNFNWTYAKWEPKDTEDIGDLMWEGEIKMDKPQFTEEQIERIYQLAQDGDISDFKNAMHYEGYTVPIKLDKPQLTEEQADQICNLVCLHTDINKKVTVNKQETIFNLKQAGYVIPVKSDEPFIVHNVMSYKGKNYLKQSRIKNDGSCFGCDMEGMRSTVCQSMNDCSVYKDFIWKSFEDIQITDELACMRKDIGDIYLIDNFKNIMELLGVLYKKYIFHKEVGRVHIERQGLRLATAEELQKYFKEVLK